MLKLREDAEGARADALRQHTSSPTVSITADDVADYKSQHEGEAPLSWMTLQDGSDSNVGLCIAVHMTYCW